MSTTNPSMTPAAIRQRERKARREAAQAASVTPDDAPPTPSEDRFAQDFQQFLDDVAKQSPELPDRRHELIEQLETNTGCRRIVDHIRSLLWENNLKLEIEIDQYNRDADRAQQEVNHKMWVEAGKLNGWM